MWRTPFPSRMKGPTLDDESADYFRRRELAERAAAKNAASDAARRVHQELAQEYAALLHRSNRSFIQTAA